jgi:hypothetical protein
LQSPILQTKSKAKEFLSGNYPYTKFWHGRVDFNVHFTNTLEG